MAPLVVSKAYLKYLFVILVILISGGGIWYLKTISQKQTADGVENWQIYRNEKYGFEIKYPNQSPVWGLRDRNERADLLEGYQIEGYQNHGIASIYYGDRAALYISEIDGNLNMVMKKLFVETKEEFELKTPHEKVLFNGMPAYESYTFTSCFECGHRKIILFEKSKDTTFAIILIDGHPDQRRFENIDKARYEFDRQMNSLEFDKIIETFKFL